MATIQSFLVCDSSTLANFKSWAQSISTAFSTFGWTQSTDTGQVNWSTIGGVPGSASYVYEIWQPNDGLTNFYLKVEYGNVAGTNCPSIRLSIATATNGAGTLTGSVVGPAVCDPTSFTAPSSVTTYECDYSGASGRIGVMMWRNGANACQQFFGVERSVNSSGAYTGNHVTLLTAGNVASNSRGSQQSFVFGIGAAPGISTGSIGGWQVRPIVANAGGNSGAFNGSIPIDTVAPMVGFFDYPLTVAGVAANGDMADGVTFTATLYGSTRTFMPAKGGGFAYITAGYNAGACLLMRYD